MVKNSKKRQAILDNLSKRYDHPTAETIYLEIKQDYPNVSLGTVYRNLSMLVDMGQIQKITTSFGPDRFDYNEKPHCHFTCRECGSVIDLDLPIQEELRDRASQTFQGKIEESSIQFVGLCPNCCKN